MIVAIGSNDTLASPGTQLDFYQAILDKMGRSKVDSFARLYVLPQTGHGLTGTNYTTDGDGKKLEAKPIPNTFDRLALLTDWVEKGAAPGKVDQSHSGRPKSADVLLSRISEVHQGTGGGGGLLAVQRALIASILCR